MPTTRRVARCVSLALVALSLSATPRAPQRTMPCLRTSAGLGKGADRPKPLSRRTRGPMWGR
jgi:hypothetical protein